MSGKVTRLYLRELSLRVLDDTEAIIDACCQAWIVMKVRHEIVGAPDSGGVADADVEALAEEGEGALEVVHAP